MFRNVSGNRGLRNIDTELQEFPVYSGRAPKRIRLVHRSDKLFDFGADTRTANAPTSPPIIPKIMASGATIGTPNRINHCSMTATTPGHSRSGCRSPFGVMVIVIMIRSAPTRCSRPFQVCGCDLGQNRSPAAPGRLAFWAHVHFDARSPYKGRRCPSTLLR